ncbi:hypothetical protein [Nonomuraea guangzhouensis]|uniref:Uncharacterized protein n=2 Tax=Nonomuraea guangzhouensis TaxID=1291555 RepID=A0ABW4G129_9ACTN|nr:hypothetical protein [Nonomuraea guangzhouensis]
MSERYGDVWDDFLLSKKRVWLEADLDDATFGVTLSKIFKSAYDKAYEGCVDALDDGREAAGNMSGALSTCARNWQRAEQASTVTYR